MGYRVPMPFWVGGAASGGVSAGVFEDEPRFRINSTGGARRVGTTMGGVEEGRLGSTSPQPGAGRLGGRSA